MALEDIKNDRLKKLSHIEAENGDAYPARVARPFLIGDVSANFGKFVKGKKNAGIVGRLVAKREHGGSTFGNMKDASGTIQIYFKEDVLGKEEYRKFSETADIGDFLEISGKPFKTKRGEETIEVTTWRIIAKSLLPLPDKWHGIQDVEERFRKRYLDLIMNDEVRARFVLRSAIISSLRSFLKKDGFQEVETPMLQPMAGGAMARPFRTHHNALDADLYLRIAPELYLKRLLIGGFEKIYELGRNFRNEGIDATHNPEFTMLELYTAYWDEEDMMKFVEKIFLALCKAVQKNAEIKYQGTMIKCKAPFKRVRFRDLLKKYALVVNYDDETQESMRLKAQRFGLEISTHESKGKIADEIYKKICRSQLLEPTFVTEHPLDISPLAKKKEGVLDTARRFQLIAGGLEIANGFAELNDPREQRSRFEEQKRMRGLGEEEAHDIDEDFIEAMEYGMPPAAGLGIGIDRLVMLLTNVKNIREVVLFPTLRQK